MLAAVLMGCGLLCFCGCKDEARQLEAAIEAVNKQFPQVIADGATLNGFYTTDFGGQKAVDIRVTLDEAKMIRAIDSLRIAQMKDDLINTFTIATRQDENLRALFALIAANHRALTLTIVQQPSGKEQRVDEFLPEYKACLGEMFEYVGLVSGNSKDAFLRSLDVFVMPTYFEGLPVSLLECMGYGVVPVVTPVGSIPDVVTDNANGLFVKVKDVDSLVNAVTATNNDRKLLRRLSNNARKTISERFSVQRYIDNLNKIYDSLS